MIGLCFGERAIERIETLLEESAAKLIRGEEVEAGDEAAYGRDRGEDRVVGGGE